MKRTYTPRKLRIISLALAVLVGVFLLSPAVTADVTNDDDGIYVGGGKNSQGGGGNGSGGSGGDDTDPDWWTMSNQVDTKKSEVVETPRVKLVYVSGPFGRLISWLLQEASGHYLSMWR